jgi:hypothetical protein
MRGIILRTQLVREEDKIVSILTEKELVTLYRFYGARHPHIAVGGFIDFTIEPSPKFRLGRLRNVVEIPTPQLWKVENYQPWERFCGQLYRHLSGVTLLPPFYYRLMEKGVERMGVERAERVLINLYWQISQFEGRLPSTPICPICHSPCTPTLSKLGVGEGLTLYHPKCAPLLPRFDSFKLLDLVETGKTLLFSDREVVQLFETILRYF